MEYTRIKLPPASGITNKSVNQYAEYKIWRKSPGYKKWLSRQWAKQDAKCFYCKCSLKGRQHNVEHIVPQRINSSSTNKARNLVLSCPPCNKSKGGKVFSNAKNLKLKAINGHKKKKKKKKNFIELGDGYDGSRMRY